MGAIRVLNGDARQQADADRLREGEKAPEISACEATTVATVASRVSG